MPRAPAKSCMSRVRKIGNFTCNVEYAVNGGEVEVLNLYSYVILLTGQED